MPEPGHPHVCRVGQSPNLSPLQSSILTPGSIYMSAGSEEGSYCALANKRSVMPEPGHPHVRRVGQSPCPNLSELRTDPMCSCNLRGTMPMRLSV